MINPISRIIRKDYLTLNKIKISKENLLENFHYLSSLDKRLKVAPVIKSNGYGHGIKNIAKIFDSVNAPFFCVDSLFEAYELKKNNLKTPVLVMGYTNPHNLKIKKLPFQFAIFDLETAMALNQYQPGCRVHIFVDTGMHREGISIEDLPEFLEQIKKLPYIKIEGLMSHLASSESNKDPLFLAQIKQYKIAKEICEKNNIHPKWFHIAATGSIINPQTRRVIAGISNLARAGLALYGYSSSTEDKNLKPALTLTTQITQIKKIVKGEKLGYEGTFTVKKDMTIGVIPIGYYDGVDRRLSNRGVALVNDIECPILGKISMNVNIIDLSKVPDPQVGQEVVIYSSHPSDKNSLGNCASICKTIPYDLLVNLADTTKRIII